MRHLLFPLSLLAASFLTAALLPSTAHASEFAIQPTLHVFPASQMTGTLVIENKGKVARTFQVRVLDWGLDAAGQDERIASTSLRFAPSVVVVQPGTSQTLRWIRTPQPGDEQRYRIKVDDLTGLLPGAAPVEGIALRINMDFPWFFRNSGAQAEVSARLTDGKLLLTNGGDATARLERDADGGLVGYVLPGQTLTVDDEPLKVDGERLRGQP
jgi:P pilus assembly chaperone PapD